MSKTRRHDIASLQGEKDCFNENLLLCLTQWAHFESGLGSVFSNLFWPRSMPAQSAFYSIQGSKAKLMLVDSALHGAVPTGAALKLWSKLKAEAESLITIRNLLVHGQILGRPHEKPGRRFCIRTPLFAVMPAIKGKIKEYYLADLESIRSRVFKLIMTLEAFGFVLLCAGGGRLPSGVEKEEQLSDIGLADADFEALRLALADEDG